MAVKLNKTVIEKAQYSGRQDAKGGWTRCMLWDNQIPGLGLRIFPSGRKAFVLRYRIDGRARLITLGDFGPLTVDMARTKAHEHLAGIEMQGADPLKERRRRIVESQATLGKLLVEYIERHAKPHKRSWEKDAGFLDRLVPDSLRTRPVRDITRDDIARLHGKIGAKTPYQANRLLEILRKAFNLGADWGYVPAGTNPARGIKRFKETKRDRWVQPDELPRLAQAIDAEESPFVRGAIWCYLLTGVRKNELLPIRWEDVDIEARTMYIRQTKNGAPFVCHMNAPALEILRGLPRFAGNPHVFPSPRKPGAAMCDIQPAWERVRKAAGLEDLRLHDLRRTFGSMLATSGTPLLMIAKALHHTSTVPTEIYARLADDPVHDAIDALGERLMEAARPKPVDNVVNLSDARRGR